MKFRDFVEAERFFSKEPKARKKELSLKDLMKFEKELEEFQKWKKDQKKDDKKPDTPWSKLSFVQKWTIVTAVAPLLLMLEGYVIVLFIAQMAKIMGMK